MSPTIGGMTTPRPVGSVSDTFAMDEGNTLYKRCATSRSAYKEVFPQITGWIPRGRSSVGRAPALQVDKPKRCAFMRFRRWCMSAVPRIMR
jgi:hypothetical protein